MHPVLDDAAAPLLPLQEEVWSAPTFAQLLWTPLPYAHQDAVWFPGMSPCLLA